MKNLVQHLIGQNRILFKSNFFFSFCLFPSEVATAKRGPELFQKYLWAELNGAKLVWA